LDSDVLTQIYGEEDWAATRARPSDDDDASGDGLDEERLAGMV
jgi:hypothetical protein